MAKKTTYLEFHDELNNSHKFYEVIERDEHATIRWGRVGQAGVMKNVPLDEARKKISEKISKGYKRMTPMGKAKTDEAGDRMRERLAKEAKQTDIWEELAKQGSVK